MRGKSFKTDYSLGFDCHVHPLLTYSLPVSTDRFAQQEEQRPSNPREKQIEQDILRSNTVNELKLKQILQKFKLNVLKNFLK